MPVLPQPHGGSVASERSSPCSTSQRSTPPSHPAVAALLKALAVGGKAIATPLDLLLRFTCPECAHDSPTAAWYPVTLLTSFVWVSFFSTVISAVVSRWGDLLCIPASFLGMYVIAIGAEIPDTIQSVTVAKRGYGSMAVSNSTGSQIINILIGLGLPWLFSNMAGREVPIPTPSMLKGMARMQAVNVLVYLSLILLPTMHTWRPGDHSKATLGRRHGYVLIGTYLAALSIEAIILANSEES